MRVRGTAAGDIIRRLVARTVAQQIRQQVERATAPFQYALSTWVGCECTTHALQVLTDQDPQSTILSVDGFAAYDTISRNSMLRGLRDMEGGETFLPFALQFYGAPSTYFVVRTVRALYMRSCRVREASRWTPSCRHGSLLDNTTRW